MITLLFGFPQSRAQKRILEFDHALGMNLKNPCIDRMILLLEESGPRTTPGLPLVFPVDFKSVLRRATFQDYVDAANEMVPEGVAVFANADIWFDWSIDKLEFIPEKTLCAITRADFSYNPWSSDAWAFRTPLPVKKCDWWLGRLGCENAFTSEVHKQSGWTLWNPHRSIRLMHVHRSCIRNTHGHVPHDPSPFPRPVLFNEQTEAFEKCL